MTVQLMISKLATEGLEGCTLKQLEPLVPELGLAGVAERAALKVLPEEAKEELAAIRSNAPLRALDQAIRNFVPGGKPSVLRGYLKRYTWFWAKRYAEDVLKGKTVPTVLIQTETGEVRSPETSEPQSTDGDSLGQVQNLLDSLGVSFQRTGPQEVSFRLGCGGVDMQFFANRFPEAVVFFGYIPLFVPIYRRAAVAEALSRINWRLLFGTFEMDLQDGQVRLRGFVPLPGHCLDLEVAGKSLSTMRHEAGTFAKVIIELALTDHDPETLVERAAASSN